MYTQIHTPRPSGAQTSRLTVTLVRFLVGASVACGSSQLPTGLLAASVSYQQNIRDKSPSRGKLWRLNDVKRVALLAQYLADKQSISSINNTRSTSTSMANVFYGHLASNH